MKAVICFLLALLTVVYSKKNKSYNIGMLTERHVPNKIDKKFTDILNKLFIVLSIKNQYALIKRVKLLPIIYHKLRMRQTYIKKYNHSLTHSVLYGKKMKVLNMSGLMKDLLREKYENFYKKLLPTDRNGNATSLESLLHANKLAHNSNISRPMLRNQSKKLVNSGRRFYRDGNVYVKVKSVNLKVWRDSNSSEEFDTINPGNTRRIYKGVKAHIKRYPFVASIHMLGEFLCGGSIISKDFILTAASCLQIPYNDKYYQENPNSLTARVGSDYTKRFGELIPIDAIFFHPKYDPLFLRHNLAVGRMKRHVIFTRNNKRIRRIELDRNGNNLLNNVVSIAMMGWGDQDALGGDYERPLSVSHLKLYDHHNCKEVYSSEYVRHENFCLGSEYESSGACNRDVGGPAIIGSTLVGVISFGPPVCGTPDAPTVFSKVNVYADWINDVINKNKISPVRTIIRNSSPITKTQLKPDPPIQELYPKEVGFLRNLFRDMILSGDLGLEDILQENKDNDQMHPTENVILDTEILRQAFNESKKHLVDNLEIRNKILKELDNIKQILAPGNQSINNTTNNYDNVISSGSPAKYDNAPEHTYAPIQHSLSTAPAYKHNHLSEGHGHFQTKLYREKKKKERKYVEEATTDRFAAPYATKKRLTTDSINVKPDTSWKESRDHNNEDSKYKHRFNIKTKRKKNTRKTDKDHIIIPREQNSSNSLKDPHETGYFIKFHALNHTKNPMTIYTTGIHYKLTQTTSQIKNNDYHIENENKKSIKKILRFNDQMEYQDLSASRSDDDSQSESQQLNFEFEMNNFNSTKTNFRIETTQNENEYVIVNDIEIK